jgi:nitrogen regulatory protein PII
MSTDDEIIPVTALIRQHIEDYVVRLLHDLPDFPDFTFNVRGQERGRGQGEAYVSSVCDLTCHQFLELRLVCKAEVADSICDRIASAAWTGRKGDGVVFTTPVHSFARIREIGRHPETRNA